MRRIIVTIITIVAILAAGSVILSGYVGWRLTHPARLYATILPSSVGVRYENVSFQSRVDHIRLSGWYMPAEEASAPWSSRTATRSTV